MKRYKRLAPPYLCAMLLYSGLLALGICRYGINWRTPELKAILANVLLLNTFSQSGQNTLVPGGWSISCIAVFAFAFPWIERWTQRHFVSKMVLATLAGLTISAVLHYVAGLPKQFCYMLMTTHFGSFAVGVAYYRWRKARGLEGLPSDVAIFAASSALLALAAVLVSFVYSAFLYRTLLVSLGFVGWLVFFERHEGCIPNMVASLGRHSYAIFIFHFAFVFVLCPVVGRLLVGANWIARYVLTYVMVAAASYFSARLVESARRGMCAKRV